MKDMLLNAILCAIGGASLGVALVIAVYAVCFGYAAVWDLWTAHLCGFLTVVGAFLLLLGSGGLYE